VTDPAALKTEISFALPGWLVRRVPANLALFSVETRMQFVLGIAREQVRRGTGGPFAAAVFGPEGELLSVGVNLVEPTQCSLLHAEMVAIALAQKALGRYDLGDAGKFDCELVTSTEPCAMCFGAVPWSGVRRLICAARDEDARGIGFDEGAKLPDWQLALEQRGISVTRDLLRADAVSILQEYASEGGLIYNGLAQGTTKV
jgi:tRNA(Arg) A34 adenosine deaminase TadA